MSSIAAFVLGLLTGWIVEWIIDWWFWRRRRAGLQAELDQAKARATAAETALKDRSAVMQAELAQAKTEAVPAKAEPEGQAAPLAGFAAGEPAPAAADIPAVTEPLAPAVAVPAPPAVNIPPDDLIVIKGIGPVINRKLNEKGITTFEQLAALTPSQLVAIVGDVIQRLADEDYIINQAKELAAKKASVG